MQSWQIQIATLSDYVIRLVLEVPNFFSYFSQFDLDETTNLPSRSKWDKIIIIKIQNKTLFFSMEFTESESICS